MVLRSFDATLLKLNNFFLTRVTYFVIDFFTVPRLRVQNVLVGGSGWGGYREWSGKTIYLIYLSSFLSVFNFFITATYLIIVFYRCMVARGNGGRLKVEGGKFFF